MTPISDKIADKSANNKIRYVGVVLLPLLVIASLMLANLLRTHPRQDEGLDAWGLVLLDHPKTVKSFNLKSHTGRDVQRFGNRWTLVFFGFTHCPDICPTTLSVLNQLATSMGNVAPNVVMVSVDPARDEAELLGQYVTAFNPEFLALTGNIEEIRSLGHQLQVVFEKEVSLNASDTPLDNYQVGHSTHISLINPAGEFIGYFRIPHRPAQIQQALAVVMTP